MSRESEDGVRAQVDAIYRAESRRAFATLVRLLRDFDLAKEALHKAFTAALEQWPREEIPNNPGAWLITAARLRGIDAMRRRRRLDATAAELGNVTMAKGRGARLSPSRARSFATRARTTADATLHCRTREWSIVPRTDCYRQPATLPHRL